MLKPGNGKTYRAYIWSYSSTQSMPRMLVVDDFADSRAAAHPKRFLGGWSGKLVCDDYAGDKRLFRGRSPRLAACACAQELQRSVVNHQKPTGRGSDGSRSVHSTTSSGRRAN